jgi:phosphoribosyl 1,2-cyclic phosphate phosphodiesterase
LKSLFKITVLGSGTSSGVPMIACDCKVCLSDNPKDKRLRSSIKIEYQGTNVVIDTTPDFRYQMLRSNTKHLDALVFTHPHKDHIAGLDDVRAYNYFSNKAMNLYANEFTSKVIKQEFHYAFSAEKYPGIPNLLINLIDEEEFEIGSLRLTPIKALHLRMPVLGFRINDFTYLTDANYITEFEKAKIMGSKVLIINALRQEKHISHFTLSEAIEIGKELNVEKVFFTHISHQMGLHDEINRQLPSNMSLAYDGLEVFI